MRGSHGVPFLMYHVLGDEDLDADQRYVIASRDFAAQLAYLDGSYEVQSVGGALATPPGVRPRVVLTFDDGNASDLEIAAPLLVERGFGATFYAVPGLLGRRGFLSVPQLRELARLGLEIGSHSMSHQYLTDLDDRRLEREVRGSKERLEDLLGRPVLHFACPGGRVDARVEKFVRAAGYASLATSHIGTNAPDTDPFRLTRVPVYGHTRLPEFARICRGEGLFQKRLVELGLGTAKKVMGNRGYERFRRFVLGSRQAGGSMMPSSRDSMASGHRTS
jgi:peptidoglycan/xylan/chitin deacetylase (PgdA/CDA1 family)